MSSPGCVEGGRKQQLVVQGDAHVWAFFSCMAWRAIPGPLSKWKRRLDSLEAAQGTSVFLPGESMDRGAWLAEPRGAPPPPQDPSPLRGTLGSSLRSPSFLKTSVSPVHSIPTPPPLFRLPSVYLDSWKGLLPLILSLPQYI